MRSHSVPGTSRLRAIAAALALALTSAVGARAALAGEAVRLVIEIPPDVTQLTCPETLDFQIIGEDAQKARVGFDRRTVEVSATAGMVELVRAPFQFRYRTPATLPDLSQVRIRAWLKESPEVQGELTIPVLPAAPYKRLMLQGPGTTPAGASVEFTLRGETQDGRTEDVPDALMNVRVEPARGTIALLRPGRYRLETNQEATGTLRIVAALKRYPNVTGTLEVLITSGGGPTQPPPTQPPPTQPPPGGGPRPPAPPPADSDADDPKDFVVWPSGNVRVEVWRVRQAEVDKWSRDRNRVASQGEFQSELAWQKLRIGVLRKDVRSITVEEQFGPKGEWMPLAAAKEGRLVVNERKDGTKAVHYEVMLPETGKRMTMRMTMRLNDGTKLEEVFLLKRVEKK